MGTAASAKGLRPWLLFLCVALAPIPLVLNAFFSIGQTYRAASPSMVPTIEPGDIIRVVPTWIGGELKRGDLVAAEGSEGRVVLKRLIGLPGDRVETQDGIVVLNSTPLLVQNARPATSDGDRFFARFGAKYLDETIPTSSDSVPKTYTIADMRQTVADNFSGTDSIPSVVQPGHYFLMGDNRDNSGDSRTALLGQVPQARVIGRPILVLYSVKVQSNDQFQLSLRFDRTFKVLR